MKIIENNNKYEIETFHKISFQIYTYFNNNLLNISEDEIFFTQNFTDDLHKFKYYIDTNKKYMNKKIGNLSFNLGLKTEMLNEMDVSQRKGKLNDLFSVY